MGALNLFYAFIGHVAQGRMDLSSDTLISDIAELTPGYPAGGFLASQAISSGAGTVAVALTEPVPIRAPGPGDMVRLDLSSCTTPLLMTIR